MININGRLSQNPVLKGEVRISSVSSNYDLLINKPKINKVELEGDKSLEEIGVAEATAQDILDLFI